MPPPKESSSPLPATNEEVEPMERKSTVGWSMRALGILCIASGVFHFYIAGTRPMLSARLFAIHLAFALAIVLWGSPVRKSKIPRAVPIYDWLTIIMALASCVYVMIYALPIMEFSYVENNLDLVLGTALILVTLEASRRTLGLVFPILVGLAICYALFGNWIPGRFGHEGFAWDVIVRNLYLTPQGLWGVMLQISATLIAMFLIFGAVLQNTGGGEAFLDLAFLTSARARGGPAKVAAVSSSLFGMISGSAVANAATTGTFTIPMMKRAGFSSNFAAAVEATASTGGMLMPPVMGAGAFLIAEFLGISYAKVAWAALMPAILYYGGVLFSVHLEAVKHNFSAIPIEEQRLIRSRLSVKKVVLPLLPVGLLVYAFSTGYTVQIGAYWASLAALGLAVFLIEEHRFGRRFWELGKTVFNSMETAGKAIAELAVLLASAQIVVSLLGLTGLTVKFSDLLVSMGQQNIIATLIMSMVLLIVLGMGVPPTGVYVLGGSIVVPALIGLGLEPLPAHLFTFYFSCLGAITPPVCAAVFVTSSLAESNWWKSGWLAVRMGLAGFIVPYMFIFNKKLLLFGSVGEILLATIPACLGVLLLSTFAVGYFFGRIGWMKRWAMAVAGVMLIHPNLLTDAVGVGVAVAVYLTQRMEKEGRNQVSP